VVRGVGEQCPSEFEANARGGASNKMDDQRHGFDSG
jgi:hypothetical protein